MIAMIGLVNYFLPLHSKVCARYADLCECADGGDLSSLVEFGNADRVVRRFTARSEERVVTRVGDRKMCSEARAVLKRYRLLR